MTLFRVMLRMRVRLGCEARFEDLLRDVWAGVAANPASVGQQVFRDTAEPSTYFVFSDWTDDAAFWEHERSAEHRRRIAGFREVREDHAMSTMDLLRM